MGPPKRPGGRPDKASKKRRKEEEEVWAPEDEDVPAGWKFYYFSYILLNYVGVSL